MYSMKGTRSRLSIFLVLLALLLVASSSSAQEPHAVKISQTQGGFAGQLSTGAQFGYNVVALGDLDGNGATDLAVSAPGDDDPVGDAGSIWILFLDSEGAVLDERKIAAGKSGFDVEMNTGAQLGKGLTATDDLDGDGVPELAAVSSDTDPFQVSTIWILFLERDGTVKRWVKNGLTLVGSPQHAHIGLLWDADGDGIRDLVWDDGKHFSALKPDGEIVTMAGRLDWLLERRTNWIGSRCGVVGDIDGDGQTDISCSYESRGRESLVAKHWLNFQHFFHRPGERWGLAPGPIIETDTWSVNADSLHSGDRYVFAGGFGW